MPGAPSAGALGGFYKRGCQEKTLSPLRPSIIPGINSGGSGLPGNTAFGENVPVLVEGAGTICLVIPICGEVEVGTAIIVLGGAAIIHEGVKDGIITIPTIHLSRGKGANRGLAQVDHIADAFCVDRNALGNAIHEWKKNMPKGLDLTIEDIKEIARTLPKIAGCTPTGQ